MIRFIICSIISILLFLSSADALAQTKKSKAPHKSQAHAQAKVKRGKTLHKKSVRHHVHTTSKVKKPKVYYGTASYYSNRFNGRKTANGSVFRQSSSTAACNRIPLGTLVRVTNVKNKKSIVVKVNDRMGSRSRRLIDLTKSGAKRLGFARQGITRVKVEPLNKRTPSARR